MSDDRGWYPAYGSDDRGGEGRYPEEPGYDPYAQGQQSGRPARGESRPPYRVERGGQPPRNPYQPPQPPQPSQRQPQQPWNADPYGRQGQGGGQGRGQGQQGQGQQGQGRGEWTPASGSGGGRPGRGYGDDGAWLPADSPTQGRRGGDGAGADDWSPRSRSRGAQSGPAVGAGAVGLAEGRVNEDIDLDELDPSGRARRSGARGRGVPASRRRKIIKWTAIGVSTTLVLILGVGAYVILHLTGNIKHSALLQNGVTQSPEPTDKYGRSPLNILVIGSDTRDNAADCHLGGDCGAGANADVEMVVHLAADRSNATVMSIPRDTIVTLPSCTDPATKAHGGGFSSTINSSLQWGPACTVTAVHNLTGLTIDHFVMVDFSGVQTLSNALGGVQVCVSAKMYDPYSKLRLNKGQNAVKGASALAFVRSRHGFYDGSDLGREKAQHYFLSAMIREVRANMNLSDFATLYKVADAATKALTVDDGLSGVSGLEGLATTMNRVPTDRISFVTMPWNIDPANQAHVLVAQPYAGEMFQNIQNDVSYSAVTAATKSGTATATKAAPATTPAALATPTVAVNKAAVHVTVLNGTKVNGRAGTIRDALVSDGYSSSLLSTSTAASTAKTIVYYPSSKADSAATVANSLGMTTAMLKESNAYSQVTVVIGADWASGGTFGGSSGAGAKATTAASAPSVSSLSNAATTGTCVPVNPHYIVK
jgi:LCP family protein required for cell wall assembly